MKTTNRRYAGSSQSLKLGLGAALLMAVALPAHGTSPGSMADSDFDGVPDAYDDESCNDQIVAYGGVPALNQWSANHYEDSFPRHIEDGGAVGQSATPDMNDVVLATNTILAFNAQQLVVSMKITVDMIAQVGLWPMGLAIKLPFAKTDVAHWDVRIAGQSHPGAYERPDANFTLSLLKDVSSMWPNSSGIINGGLNQAHVQSKGALVIKIDL